ncbi:cytochrome c biogenesis protein [Spirochaeta isovalerica]|uniref:Cytochrome c biogenesis protein CcdA n=1 Tax=Spirochaeta isovalerica TaxID=150 RepID=A0A841R8T0_9SPIO|nr:cytochrome c biogenesis protein CcdA [Spirochaeta isovalerica]MBB6479587.1 cytochrome c biogenesis protein CcdA [Spirochaeta isovalerica]
MTTEKYYFAFFLILIITFSLHGEILLDSIPDGEDWIITISNRSDETYDAMIVSADSAYKCEKGQISVPPGEEEELKIIREGETFRDQLYLRFISDHEDNPGIYAPGREEISPELSVKSETEADIEYFYTPDCSRCREFLDRTMPELEEKLEREISLSAVDVTTAEGLQKLMEKLEDLRSREKRLPLIVIGETILAGDRDIEEGLEEALRQSVPGKTLPADGSSLEKTTGVISLSILPVFTAGLLDGINPCAFSTLIFLLSWLSLAGRSRKEILLTGILFSLSVFVTYYAVGLGAFTALRAGDSLRWISLSLKYIMAAVLIVLAILHLADYRKMRMGKTGEIALQLSRERKRKIHSLVRENTRKAGLITGSLVLGFTVTIFELGCTGQIYLPTLMYMTRMEGNISSYLLLGFYNLAFIIPLLAVFIMAWKGMTSQRLAEWFSRKAGSVKLISALFFLAMAALLLILL